MNRRSILDFPRNEAGLVDEFIGTAFDAVYSVYRNLDEILTVDANTIKALEAAMAAARSELAAGKYALDAKEAAESILGTVAAAVAARDAAKAYSLDGFGYLQETQATVIGIGVDRLAAEEAAIAAALSAEETQGYAAQVGPIRADLADQLDPALGTNLIGFDGQSLIEQLKLSKKLASYEALRAYTGLASRIELTGFGIGGIFTLVTGTFTDDGAVFIVGAGGRMWQRENAYPFKARWFGMGLGKVTNNAALTAANLAASRLGATLQIDPGNYNMDNTPVTAYTNVLTIGSGKKSTTLNVAPGTTGVLFDYVLAPGSYNEGGLSSLTINNSGSSIGLAAVRTPQDAAGFNNAQKYNFDGLGFQGQGWQNYLDIGDCAMGSARNIELRGKYDPTQADTGQADCGGIKLSGAKGNVRMTIDGFAMLGIRRGLVLGENAEGFALVNGEITSTWIGVSGSPLAAKPGGFIDNVHISCNKGGIELGNRRDMTMGTVQIYRSNGMFDHGQDWNALNFSNCRRITVPSLLVRVFPGVFTGNNIAVSMSGASDKCYVEDLTLSETGGVTRAVNVSGATNCGVDEISCEGVDEWVHLNGVVSNWHTRQINSPTVGANPFAMGAQVDRAAIDMPKVSCVREYNEATYSAAADVTWKPRLNSATQKISCTTTGVFTVNVTLDYANAVVDDMFDVHLVMVTGSVKTVVFLDSRTGTPVTVLTVAGNAAANTFKNVTFRFNGAGWVIHRYTDGLA